MEDAIFFGIVSKFILIVAQSRFFLMWNEDPKTLTVDTRLKLALPKIKGGKGDFFKNTQ